MEVIKLEVITLGNGSFKYQAIKDGKVIATRTSKRGYVAALIYEGRNTINNGIGRYDLIESAVKRTPNADYLARLDFQEAPVNDTPAGPFVVNSGTDSYDAVAALMKTDAKSLRKNGGSLLGLLSSRGYIMVNLTYPLLVKYLPYGKNVLALFHGGAMAVINNDKTHQVEVLGSPAELDTPIAAYWVKKADAYNLYGTDGTKYNNYPLNIDQAQKMAFLSNLNYNRKLTIL